MYILVGVGVVWGQRGGSKAQSGSQTTSGCLIVKVRLAPVKVGPSLSVGPRGEITTSLVQH